MSQPLSSTARQRLCRQRRRTGVKIVPIEVCFDMCDGLEGEGYLEFTEAETKARIKCAIEKLLMDIAGRHA